MGIALAAVDFAGMYTRGLSQTRVWAALTEHTVGPDLWSLFQIQELDFSGSVLVAQWKQHLKDTRANYKHTHS